MKILAKPPKIRSLLSNKFLSQKAKTFPTTNILNGNYSSSAVGQKSRLRETTETLRTQFYFASLSSRTIVYKGMLTTHQLGKFYRDLQDERFSNLRSVWFIRVSAQIHFRAGRARSRCATSRIMARSTPCAAISIGCMRVKKI